MLEVLVQQRLYARLGGRMRAEQSEQAGRREDRRPPERLVDEIAPNSKLPVKADGAAGVEFTVREVGDEVFILACKREGETAQVTFKGLSATMTRGDVVYESPRKIEVKNGQFTDWFGPEEVHVYRIRR